MIEFGLKKRSAQWQNEDFFIFKQQNTLRYLHAISSLKQEIDSEKANRIAIVFCHIFTLVRLRRRFKGLYTRKSYSIYDL